MLLRGVFKALMNTYHSAFFSKRVSGQNPAVFSQKDFLVDIWQGFKRASDISVKSKYLGISLNIFNR